MSTKRPHILITNDDGVHAPGIKHLWQALKPHARLTVVAPAFEQSSMGLSITIRQPLRVEQASWQETEGDVWSVTGTPADCVKLALHTVLKERPDIVVSGINRGSNLGRNVLYSGTVAAAIESILQKIPAIAFSCQDYSPEPDYQSIGKYISPIVNYVLKHPLPLGSLLNVNFPERNTGVIKGVKLTSQGTERWAENPSKRTHPTEEHSYFWLGNRLTREEEEEGDGVWIRRGYITAVPVHVADLTDRQYLQTATELFDNSFHGLF